VVRQAVFIALLLAAGTLRFLYQMSLKAELETWASALQAYDEENFERALELFSVNSLSPR
jgi:hypothetical protein